MKFNPYRFGWKWCKASANKANVKTAIKAGSITKVK